MTVSLAPLGRPPVVGALHLPDWRRQSVAETEDYVLANAAVFAEAGFPALMLQDQTRETGAAAPATVATMAALGIALRRAHPGMALGIIVQAHDAAGPLAIARACGAAFVRLKVFVAASMTMEGPRTGLGVEAVAYRDAHAPDVAILSDVFDRTSIPMVDLDPAQGAAWAERLGADGLVITGASFPDSLARIAAARKAGVSRPVLLGGSVTEANVAEALAVADGAIVSSALMRPADAPGILRWDPGRSRRFMEAVRAAAG